MIGGALSMKVEKTSWNGHTFQTATRNCYLNWSIGTPDSTFVKIKILTNFSLRVVSDGPRWPEIDVRVYRGIGYYAAKYLTINRFFLK
jgi:hypothetical protein